MILKELKILWEKDKNKSVDTIFLTAEEYIHKTAKKNNIDIDNLMNECHQSQTVGQLGSRKKKVMKEIEKSKLSKTEKKILKECVESSTNTHFGTKKETKVVKILEKMENMLFVQEFFIPDLL